MSLYFVNVTLHVLAALLLVTGALNLYFRGVTIGLLLGAYLLVERRPIRVTTLR